MRTKFYIDLYDYEKGEVILETPEMTKKQAYDLFKNIAENAEIINERPTLCVTLYKCDYECGNEVLATKFLNRKREIMNDVREAI